MESLPGYDAWKTREPDYSGPACTECKSAEAENGSAYCADCRVDVDIQSDVEESASERDEAIEATEHEENH